MAVKIAISSAHVKEGKYDSELFIVMFTLSGKDTIQLKRTVSIKGNIRKEKLIRNVK